MQMWRVQFPFSVDIFCFHHLNRTHAKGNEMLLLFVSLDANTISCKYKLIIIRVADYADSEWTFIFVLQNRYLHT